MGNYDGEPLESVFFLFPKKTKMGKWDRELLEMLLDKKNVVAKFFVTLTTLA